MRYVDRISIPNKWDILKGTTSGTIMVWSINSKGEEK